MCTCYCSIQWQYDLALQAKFTVDYNTQCHLIFHSGKLSSKIAFVSHKLTLYSDFLQITLSSVKVLLHTFLGPHPPF